MWKPRLSKLSDFLKKICKDKPRFYPQADKEEKYTIMNRELFYLFSVFKIYLHTHTHFPLYGSVLV